MSRRAGRRRRAACHKNFVGSRVFRFQTTGEHGPRAGADPVAARDVGRLQQEVAPAVVVARNVKTVLGPVPGAFSINTVLGPKSRARRAVVVVPVQQHHAVHLRGAHELHVDERVGDGRRRIGHLDSRRVARDGGRLRNGRRRLVRRRVGRGRRRAVGRGRKCVGRHLLHRRPRRRSQRGVAAGHRRPRRRRRDRSRGRS